MKKRLNQLQNNERNIEPSEVDYSKMKYKNLVEKIVSKLWKWSNYTIKTQEDYFNWLIFLILLWKKDKKKYKELNEENIDENLENELVLAIDNLSKELSIDTEEKEIIEIWNNLQLILILDKINKSEKLVTSIKKSIEIIKNIIKLKLSN